MSALTSPARSPLLIAPIIGSFLGVLILPLPERRPLLIGRLACVTCGTTLRRPDLVPLVSFSLQRGRGRYCGRAIGWFHTAIELAAPGIAAWGILCGESWQQMWIDCLLGWSLRTLNWIDTSCFLL